MANTSSERPADERERPARESSPSSLGSSLLLRAVAFIVLMFVIGFGIDVVVSIGIIDDSEMINVIIGIFLSLGILGIVLSVIVGTLGLVRRFRR